MQVVPRPLGQVLGDSVSTLGRTWRSLAPPALLVFIPAGLATLLVFRQTGAVDLFDLILNEPTFLQTLPPEAVIDFLLPFYQATVLVTLINTLAAVFVFLVCHRVVAADVASGTTPPSPHGHAARKAPAAFVAWLLAALIGGFLLVVGFSIWLIPASLVGAPNVTSTLIAGFLLPVLLGPAVWVWVATSMVTPAIALEGLGPLAGLRRSIFLVKGRWWPTLGYLLLVGGFGLIALQLIQMVAIPLMALGGVGMAVNFAAAVGILAQGLIVAGIGAMLTWWYLDLRARKETLLSEDLR